MELKDKTMKCKDCGEEFIFSVREQEFYAEKGFQNEPQRCKACRDKKKLERGSGDGRSFGGNRPGAGNGNFGKPKFGNSGFGSNSNSGFGNRSNSGFGNRNSGNRNSGNRNSNNSNRRAG